MRVVSREISGLMVTWKLLRKSAIWLARWSGFWEVVGGMSWLGKSVVVALAYDFFRSRVHIGSRVYIIRFNIRVCLF